VSGATITVFGGTGFVGKYVVNELARGGSQVVCPFRSSEEKALPLKQMGDLSQVTALRLQLAPRPQPALIAASSRRACRAPRPGALQLAPRRCCRSSSCATSASTTTTLSSAPSRAPTWWST
jgi:NAD(P)-dependent dehydrogenase (short-subunit alcohol dehydrogenase family)